MTELKPNMTEFSSQSQLETRAAQYCKVTFGVKKLSKLSLHKNVNASNNRDEPFPKSRFVMICSDCSPEDRHVPCHANGCCSLKMRATLVLTDGDPFLQIKEKTSYCRLPQSINLLIPL